MLTASSPHSPLRTGSGLVMGCFWATLMSNGTSCAEILGGDSTSVR